MQNYSVIVENNTEETGVACLYWTVAFESLAPPVVWLTTDVHWGHSSTITWTPQWQFVWVKAQSLDFGTILTPGEVLNADLNTKDLVTLDYDSNSGPAFKDLRQNPRPGALEIISEPTVPWNQVAAGIGMADAPVAVQMYAPSYTHRWDTHLTLWIAFRDHFTSGQVLDTSIIGETVEIAFPANVYSLTAVLNADRSWSVKPTPS